MRKTGCVQEGTLPQSFLKDGQLHDQTAWSILEPDWRRVNGVWRPDRTTGLASPHLVANGTLAQAA